MGCLTRRRLAGYVPGGQATPVMQCHCHPPRLLKNVKQVVMLRLPDCWRKKLKSPPWKGCPPGLIRTARRLLATSEARAASSGFGDDLLVIYSGLGRGSPDSTRGMVWVPSPTGLCETTRLPLRLFPPPITPLQKPQQNKLTRTPLPGGFQMRKLFLTLVGLLLTATPLLAGTTLRLD